VTRRAVLFAGALLLVACGGHASRSATLTDASGPGSTAPASSTATAAARHTPDGDWTRFNYDAQRSGVGPAKTGITAANVTTLRRRVVHVDGTVDSAAIQLHAIKVGGRPRDVAVMTTSYGRTLAIDPGTGAKLWEYVPAGIGRYEGSYQVTTATPVADPDRRFVYAASPDGVIHKLSITTGRAVWNASITFDASKEKIAPALNLSGRFVIAVTGGYYGDAPSYQGHVAMIDRATGRVAHVYNTLCSSRRQLLDPPSSCSASDSAIWARAGAVLEPGSGRILVATGNGPFNGSTNWGNSVLELTADATRLLHNWTPVNGSQLSASDTDVGSTAPALLPGRLAVQGGKDGKLRLLDLDRLNGTAGPAGPRLGGELQSISTPGGGDVLTAPAVSGSRVFVADDAGTAAYQLGADRRLHTAWHNGTSGTSPVIAGGLLYVYDQSGGALDVYRPANGALLASLPTGSGHWNSPIVVGGRVIVPEGNYMSHASSGVVDVYYLPGR
jgi:outer membrane protein assembly factor BamB